MSNQPPTTPDYSIKSNRVALLAQIAHECAITGSWEEVLTRNGQIARIYKQNPAVAIQALKQIAVEIGPEPEDEGFDVDVEYTVLSDEEATSIAEQSLIRDDDEDY